MSKRIPISLAKKIAKELGYTQVIIHAYDSETGTQHVTTYGKSIDDCANAAEGGNRIKRLLNWDKELCDAKPTRIINKEKREKKLKNK